MSYAGKRITPIASAAAARMLGSESSNNGAMRSTSLSQR